VVTLQHPELEVLVRVNQITDPRPPLSPLLHSLLLSLSPGSDPIRGLPNPHQVLSTSLETNPLDRHCSLVFRTAYSEVLGSTSQCSGEVGETILSISVGFVEGEVDVGGRFGSVRLIY